MNNASSSEPIQLIPNQLVEVDCEVMNLTGLPDEEFTQLQEMDPPRFSVSSNGKQLLSTPASSPPTPTESV